MHTPNVNELDIDTMLTTAETMAGIMRVVYSLQHVEDYTKENGANDLLQFLNQMGYLDHPLEVRKG